MGWDYTYDATRGMIVAERIKNWENENVKATCLAHTCKGNVLWTVWEHHCKQDIYHDHHVKKEIDGKEQYVNEPVLYKKAGEVYRYIGCDLLGRSKGCGWGYKSMSESMGPFYYSCPLSYLEMVPVANAEWRENVRKHHTYRDHVAEVKLKFKEIDHETQEIVLKLKHGYRPTELVMISATPFRGKDGAKPYSVPQNAVESFEIRDKE